MEPIVQPILNTDPDAGDMWRHKPFWCQPWTIVLTGVMLVTGSWIFLHRLWVTVPVGIVIGLWWWYFLGVMPRLVREMAQQSQQP